MDVPCFQYSISYNISCRDLTPRAVDLSPKNSRFMEILTLKFLSGETCWARKGNIKDVSKDVKYKFTILPVLMTEGKK